MLGVSDSSGNSSGGAASGNQEGDVGVVGGSITIASDVGGGIGGGGEDEKMRTEEGDRNLTGNRWPRQETLALLKIRSDMDVAFRDSTLKGPLWEEISRKLAELGYHRSAKKCKEKFENVYKYHKRTKEGRAARPDGKSYRFFDQLQALDHHHPSLLPPLSPSKPVLQSQSSSPAAPPPMPITATPSATAPPPPMPIAATPSAAAPASPMPITATPSAAAAAAPPSNVVSREIVPASTPTTTRADPGPNLSSPMTTSSSSEDESGGSRSHSRKRKKLTDFFEKLMNEVIQKQEMLQKKFLEAIEKRERERVAREEAWKVQEMARLNREHEMMLQERSIAAAKDAAVIAFLQKLSEQASPVQSSELLLQLHENQKRNSIPNPNPIPIPVPVPIPIPNPNPNPNPPQQPAQPPSSQAQPSPEKMVVAISRPPPDNAADSFATTTSGGGGGGGGGSSSRWPKPEVQALIKLRTSMDVKYQENGPKGPLWEEISSSMRKLGYNRNAKRCKEKWENINKYFKKVKESNKKRPEESKTCPYFHQLDALYKEKSQMQLQKIDSSSSSALGMGMVYGVKPENMVMPLRQEPLRPQSDVESENNVDTEMEPNQEHENGDDEDDDDDDDEGGDYEIVANNSSSMAIAD